LLAKIKQLQIFCSCSSQATSGSTISSLGFTANLHAASIKLTAAYIQVGD
jgi:hypothetical protein